MNDFQVDIASVNTLQNGLPLNMSRDAASKVRPHPVEEYFTNGLSAEDARHRKIETGLFGIGFTMERDTELRIFSQVRRPPMFQSSFALLNGITGMDDDIQVQDYMGVPTQTMTEGKDDHQIMDAFYGY